VEKRSLKDEVQEVGKSSLLFLVSEAVQVHAVRAFVKVVEVLGPNSVYGRL
jgi:hypothetical protein